MRFPSFTNVWEESSLGKECFSLSYGIGAKSVPFDGVHRYLRITDIGNEEKEFVSPDFLDEKAILRNGDLLLARTGATVGRSYLYQTDGVETFYAGFLIRARSKGMNPYFLYCTTQTDRYLKWAKTMSARSGQPGINAEEFSSFKVYIPAKEEADKIASFLSLIDRRIAVQNKIIRSLESLMNGISALYFDRIPDHFKTLDNLIQVGKAGGTPKSTNADFYRGDIPFLSITDMTRQGKYIKSTDKHINAIGLKNSSAWIVPENSLILSMYASVGLACINKVPLATSQAMFSMVLKTSENLDYLYYFLEYFRKTQIHKYLETGTQSNINADTVKSIKVPFYENQSTYVKTMLAVERKLNDEKEKLVVYISLKKTLLRDLFI